MARNLSVAVFGYGYMGRIRVAELLGHPSVGRVVVVEPNLGNAVPAGVAHIRDPAALDWPSLDAAFVCVPNDRTVDLVVTALDRVDHVFCEKPPGRSLSELRAMEQALEAKPGRVLSFGFNHRLHPGVQYLERLLREERFGRPTYAHAVYGKSGGQKFPEGWRADQTVSGGGILLDQGIHALDLLLHLLGDLDLSGAVLTKTYWHEGAEDNAMVLLRSRSGIGASLHSSNTMWRHTFELEVGCRDAVLTLTGLLSKTGAYGREKIVITHRQFEDTTLAIGNPEQTVLHFDRDTSWQQEVDDFVVATQERRPPRLGTVQSASRVMGLIEKIYAEADER